MYTPKFLDVIVKISELTPKEKNIAEYFYQCEIARKKGTMNDLFMRLDTIAKKSGCSVDTVIRFFKKYPSLVLRQRRKRQTNRYFNQEMFIKSMSWMDDFGMLKMTQKQQKRMVQRLLKKELESVYENVPICDPCCPNLRPNPRTYPKEINVHKTSTQIKNLNEELSGNHKIDRLPFLEPWQKKRLRGYSERSIAEALADCCWYESKKKILNPYGFLLSRLKHHSRN